MGEQRKPAEEADRTFGVLLSGNGSAGGNWRNFRAFVLCNQIDALLSVVSIDIPVLRDSKVTKCIFYAKSKEGKDIAEAISNAASNKANVSSEMLLKHLDEEFLNQMKRIVGELENEV